MDDPSPADFEPDTGLKLSLGAALSRQYAADARSFLRTLAGMMESALPECVRVETRGGLFSRKQISAVHLTLGEWRYRLADPGDAPLEATRTHVVRGITLKNEEIPVEEWVAEVGDALEQTTRANARARDALARLTGL